MLILILIILWYRTLNIKNIYVVGNKLLSEQEIIEEANLTNYPKIYEVSKSEIENKLLKNDLIKKVTVSKTLLGKINIIITENTVLLKLSDNKYLTDENKEIIMDEDLLGIPILKNDCKEIQEKLLKRLLLVNTSILNHISEIEYQPNDLDKERFMCYMNDGNYVYITLSKIELINSYNEIYPTLDNKKGILYLDSGNHFEIKK